MATEAPSLRLGIEEEYLLIDPVGGDLVRAPDPAFMAACRDALGQQVTHELLQAQVEVATPPCATVAEARAELARLRRRVAETAHTHGMAILAASTHPFASWTDQASTDKEREKPWDLRHLRRPCRAAGGRASIASIPRCFSAFRDPRSSTKPPRDRRCFSSG